MRYITVDVDSFPIEVHGHQPGSAYNGHYGTRIYHPLVATLGETGALLDLTLREGAVHTAHGAVDFIVPLLSRVETKLGQVAAVRIDAGFPNEELLSALEERRTPYVARLRNNPALDRLAEPHLRRPPGRRPAMERSWTVEMSYQAQSWSRPRRVVLVVLDRPEVTLLLCGLAYNLMHAARMLVETETGHGMSLKTLRQRVLTVASRVVLHARRATLVIGEMAASLWQRLGARLTRLRPVDT